MRPIENKEQGESRRRDEVVRLCFQEPSENLGPTGYTPCEPAALVGGAMHPASLHDALAEQSALTRSQAMLAASFRLIM